MKINKTLKLSLIIAVIIISLSLAYYYVIFLPNSVRLTVKAGVTGSVIQVHNAAKFVIINLGKSSGIKNGMQVSVMRGNTKIAAVTINDARKNISAGEIVSLVSGYTIQEGDTVVRK